MKKIFAMALMLAAGSAQAGIPAGMPANASAMTLRDDCFQRLRGHLDSSAQQRGLQVTEMTEGYGAQMENGNFECRAKFDLKAADGVRQSSPWLTYVVFANGQPAGSKSSADELRDAMKGL